jgi:hypothetical protein
MYSKKDKKIINEVIKYTKTMIGVPYRWWIDGEKISGDDKFFSKNGSAITRYEIDKKNKCIACTGLVNLMRRYLKLSIPGLDGKLNDIEGNLFPGTTSVWFEYLKRNSRLEKIDVSKKYPKGTMVIRNYSDVSDQGHVAVVIDEKGNSILDQRIIHSYATKEYSVKNINSGKTGTTNFKISHYFNKHKGYYTHICLPENWLSKD